MWEFLFFVSGIATGLAVVGAVVAIKQYRLPKGRRGLYIFNTIGTGRENKGNKRSYCVLVREKERMLNGISKIEIEEITNCNSKYDRDQVISLVGNIVNTNDVKWENPLDVFNEN